MSGPANPRPARRWQDLRQRAISAAVLAPLALGVMWAGGDLFALLTGALAFGLMAEWTRLCRTGSWRPAWLLIGLGWIVTAGAALIWLRADAAVGRANVMFVLLAVWASDVGGYTVGRLLGGAKLAPTISPGKTWSGAAGGLIAAILVAAGAAKWQVPGTSLASAAALGAGLSLIGQAGDLLESAVKRKLGVKDTGRLIPGHGGLLDRLDAALAAIPAAAVLSLILGRGVVLWQ